MSRPLLKYLSSHRADLSSLAFLRRVRCESEFEALSYDVFFPDN